MEYQKKYRSLEELAELVAPEQHSGSQSSIPVSQKKKYDGKGNTVHLMLDTHGRKGKSVTIVSGLQHNPTTREDIARILKQYCGTGGTVKEGKIELQGDQRARAAEKLKEMNYIVK
ncbi:MAG: translation initiation factor [Ignavibacteriales bacterium]|nr:translation initiation factor [Ignavibacteriales bacterium]